MKKIFALLLAVMMVVSLLPTMAFAEDHTHSYTNGLCSCGEHNGDHASWTNWGDSEEEWVKLPDTAGKYYLTHDIMLPKTTSGDDAAGWFVPDGTTDLCLNGHAIKLNVSDDEYAHVIVVKSDSILNIHDCNGNNLSYDGYTIRDYSNPDNGLWVLDTENEKNGDEVEYDITGGIITGGNAYKNPSGGNLANGGGIYVEGGELNLYGGTIAGNKAYSEGSAVYVKTTEDDKETSFTMYGGTIVGNSFRGSTNEGGAVHVSNYMDGNSNETCRFIMNGGAITRNGGTGVTSYCATIIVNDGAITDNNIYNHYGQAGYGVLQRGNQNLDIFEMNGGVISGHSYYGAELVDGKSHISGTALITGNSTGYDKPGGIYFSGAELRIDGNASISENLKVGITVEENSNATNNIYIGGNAKISDNGKTGIVFSGANLYISGNVKITGNGDGGVNFDGTNLYIGGTPVISGNEYTSEYDGDLPKNLQIPEEKPITLGTGESGNKWPVLQSGANIGVTLGYGIGGRFSNNGKAEETKYFFSDNDMFFVAHNTDDSGYLELIRGGNYPYYGVIIIPSENGIVYADKQIVHCDALDKTVTLEAIPDPGYTFKNFTVTKADNNANIPLTGNTFQMPDYSNAIVSSVFEKEGNATITYAAGTGGSVSPTSESLEPDATASGSTATANNGYHFVNWTDKNGNEVSTSATFVPAKVNGFNVTATYTANFEENPVITYAAGTGGSVSPTSESLEPDATASGSTATANNGYHFVNWTDKNGNEVSTSATFVPAKVDGFNVTATYTANFEEIPTTVHGNVMQCAIPNNVNVPDATVDLLLGKTKVKTTTTDQSGNYNFDDVGIGSYNIVVTKNNITHTELVKVDTSKKDFVVDILLPDGDVSSKVEHSGEQVETAKSDINKTVVGGVNKIAAKEKIPENGDKILIKLLIEPKNDTKTEDQEAIRALVEKGRKIEFLDLTLTKQLNANPASNIGDDNDELLTIVIPFNFTGVYPDSVEILRKHETAEKLKKDPASGEEGYTIDTAAGTITVYAFKFSTYAISYDDGTYKPEHTPEKHSYEVITIGGNKDKEETKAEENPDTGAPVLSMSTGIAVLCGVAFVLSRKK